MGQNEHSTTDPEKGFDPSIQSEKIAFDNRDMVECSACTRNNPPNRLACLYCGEMLDVDRLQPSALKPVRQASEAGGAAFSVISVPFSTDESTDISAAARLLSLDHLVMQTIISAAVRLPLSRVASESEAGALRKLLSGHGVESVVVDERSLGAEKPPIRLAGVEFLDSEVMVSTFNSRETIRIPYQEVVLMVEGVIAVNKVDQTERRRGGKSRTGSETFTAFDEPILDIYSSKDTKGFRIVTSGFDFSCLGARKSLIAGDNLKELILQLSNACPNVKIIDGYRSLRAPIGQVWEVEMRRDAKGLQVTGFGKREISSVLSTNNLDQFTRFSRLQRLLL